MLLAVILLHFGRQVAAFDDIDPDDSGSEGCESGYGMQDDNCGKYYVESRRAANPRGMGNSFPQYFTSILHAGNGFAVMESATKSHKIYTKNMAFCPNAINLILFYIIGLCTLISAPSYDQDSDKN